MSLELKVDESAIESVKDDVKSLTVETSPTLTPTTNILTEIEQDKPEIEQTTIEPIDDSVDESNDKPLSSNDLDFGQELNTQNDFEEFGQESQVQDEVGFNDFDEESQAQDDEEFDEFGEFDNDFVDAVDDDDFGDFDDFEEPIKEEEPQLVIPTEAELYVNVLENKPEDLTVFIESYLNTMWGEESKIVSSPIEQNYYDKDILNTPCSRDLWTKLSRDTVFYNPVTGAVGQFQWTRSETNKSYLNALGVTFSSEEKSHSSPTSPSHINTTKKRQTVHGPRTASASSASLPSSPDGSQTHLRSASATGGLRVVTNKMDETTKEAKKEADQEMELDIDIARAYCELTEETIRVFPDVKLNAMVIELSRLQRQAADYLDNLLDQREQLKMDAETYNDLISCIVGHAQRLHVHNKDGTPAMVSKKKTNGTFSNIMRRKTTQSNIQSVSMGGGVVGVKKPPAPKRTVSTAAHPVATSETRRSM
ncbi:hypothetical protein INT48_007786 [Thamnidium elegans]|uniref:Uncharacterized protein n=1 Tax=Thamnidium elegans TaxID=101142 RepID=A0A8H7VSF6_9FUNG|nr:hypothetical protein INT48_007786 [Thamnidium elegans]